MSDSMTGKQLAWREGRRSLKAGNLPFDRGCQEQWCASFVRIRTSYLVRKGAETSHVADWKSGSAND